MSSQKNLHRSSRMKKMSNYDLKKNDHMEKLFEQIKKTEKERRLAKENKPITDVDVIVKPPKKETNDTAIISASKLKIAYSRDSENENRIIPISHSDAEEEPGYYIAQDSELKNVDSYVDTIKNFSNIVKHSAAQLKHCKMKISEADREIQDILHEIRRPKKDLCQGYLAYIMCHYAELKRQDYKDTEQILLAIDKYIADHQTVFNGIHSLVKDLEIKLKNRKDRIYMPRSDLKLPVGNAFRALPEQRQKEIKNCHLQIKRQLKAGTYNAM